MPPRRPRAYSGRRKRKSVQDEDIDTPTSNKKVRWNTEPTEDSSEDEGDDELKSDTEEEEEKHLCLTATCLGGRLGAAFYDRAKCTMYLVEDTIESAHYDLSHMLFEQTKPDVILAPSRADEDFLTLSREQMEETGGFFQVRPHREFVPEKGRDKMLSLAIFNQSSAVQDNASSYSASTSDRGSRSSNAYNFMQRRRHEAGDPTTQRHQALIRMANYANSEIPLCLSAVGALLDYLAREQSSGDLEQEGIFGLDIQNIETLAIDQVMQINADALSSLQIFDDEGHASMHSGRSKEGLSLFGILDFTKTSFGRSLLRQWCLRPSLSISEIEARHDAVSCFVRGENSPVADAMHTQLKGLKNVMRSFGIVKAGKGTTTDWQVLVKFTYHISRLMETMADLSHTQDILLLEKLKSTVDVNRFQEMGATINETIDWETSENERRTCVRPRVDEELDQHKQMLYGLDHLLSKVAIEVKKDIPDGWAETLNVLYFPQLGYLICVPLREEWTEQADFEVIEGWTYQFSSDISAYFKNPHMTDLDEHIGDLHSTIADREIEIIQRLQEFALDFENEVYESCKVCAELDCLLSFAVASRMYDYCRPRMVEDNMLHIKRGRHPLVERLADVFVANDAYLVGGHGEDLSDTRTKSASPPDEDTGSDAEIDEDHDGAIDEDGKDDEELYSIAICTGANACGKSVYLKQNALIPFMAQIGCFVPAESATLGIVDKIFTRLQTRESVSKIQSTFMIDLSQVSIALRNATARSLILLDEFGNGTTPADGAGLFCGVIHHLLALRNETDGTSSTPKVFAATHFHEIFVNGLLDSKLRINYMHMEAMLSKPSGQLVDMDNATSGMDEVDGTGAEGVEIHYLYRVAKGLSLNSHATKCALMYGVPKSVVSRAEHVSSLVSQHELGQLLDEDLTDAEQRELEEAEMVCRAFVDWDLGKDVTEVKGRLAKVLGVEQAF